MSFLAGIGKALDAFIDVRKTGRAQKRNFNHQRELNRVSREFSREEREAMQDYAADEALKSRTFSAKQAARQMDFQKEMSSTQNQRAAKDLQKAGLNRILALGKPAVAPVGAAGSPQTARSGPGPHNPGSAGGGGAVNTPISLAQARLLDQQTKLLKAKTRGESAWADKLETVGIPFSMVMDKLGRGGAAAGEVASFLEKLMDKTGGNFFDLLRNAGSTGKELYEAGKKQYKNVIEIKRANHKNDRTKNWEK